MSARETKDASEALDIVGAIYDCAIEPALWPQAMERICAFVGAASGGIAINNPITLENRVAANWNGAPELISDLGVAANPLLTAGWFVDLDEIITPRGYLGEEAFLKSSYYHEVARKHGICDGALSVLSKTAERIGALNLIRAAARGPFTEMELARARLLAPHIRRAAMIADLLEMRALQEELLSSVLDLVAAGIVLVDAATRIVHANRAAERMLDERYAVQRRGDTLSTRDPKAAAEIRDAIANAASGNTMLCPKSGIAVPILGEGGRDLGAWVLPLDAGLRTSLAAPFAARAAIFLRELGDSSPFAGELIVRRYGISPAECHVMMMLVQGMNLAGAADARGISENTARTHLKRLFEKTGTHSQAELVRLAMTTLAPAAS